jgi:NAD(P)-dependent dehydrogenase (short-subunit alcohol dehydrogenase family)
MSKTVLVTGANTGIGYALCKLLATEHGCSVLLGSRTKSKGEKAVADIKKLAPNASVELVEIDVSSDESVAAAAAAVKAKGVTLYGLAPCRNQVTRAGPALVVSTQGWSTTPV